MSKTSLEELQNFIAYTGDKGIVPQKLASDRRGAVAKVLSILDDAEKSDVTVLDLDEISLRFTNLHGKNYTPGSLKTYLSKTRTALEDFKRYLDDPINFKGSLNKRRQPRGLSSALDVEAEKQQETNTYYSADPVKETSGVMKKVDEIEQTVLPIPIRENLIVKIYGIPFDLSEAEANKIANVIRAMAM